MDEGRSLIRRLALVAGSAVFLAALTLGLHLAIAARAGGGSGSPHAGPPLGTSPPWSAGVAPSSETTSAEPLTTDASLPCPDDVLCSDATTCTTGDDSTGQADDPESCTDQPDCLSAATSDVPPDSDTSCTGDDTSG